VIVTARFRTAEIYSFENLLRASRRADMPVYRMEGQKRIFILRLSRWTYDLSGPPDRVRSRRREGEAAMPRHFSHAGPRAPCNCGSRCLHGRIFGAVSPECSADRGLVWAEEISSRIERVLGGGGRKTPVRLGRFTPVFAVTNWTLYMENAPRTPIMASILPLFFHDLSTEQAVAEGASTASE